MNTHPSQRELTPVSHVLLRDFAAFAGRNGALACIFILAGALLEGLGLSVLVPMLGLFSGRTAPGTGWGRLAGRLFQFTGAASDFSRLLLLMGIFGAVLLLRTLVVSERDLRVAGLQFEFVKNLRLGILRRLTGARWDYIARLQHARVTHVMAGDIQRLAMGLAALVGGMVSMVMLLGQFVLAALLNPIIAIVLAMLFGVGALGSRRLLRRSQALGNYLADMNLYLLNGTTQYLGGLKLAVSQNLEKNFLGEAERALSGLSDRQMNHARQSVRNRAVISVLSALVAIILVVIGFGLLHMTPAFVITLLVLVSRMTGPATLIQQSAQQFAGTLGVYRDIKSFDAELLLAARDAPSANAPEPVAEGPIVFDKVRFQHQPAAAGEPANIDLVISKGEFLGVTGPSGRGKTTFADLLAGLYPPQSGKIRIGDTELNVAALPGWRNALSYVCQDSYLFHDTLRANLAWANPAARDEEMWRALGLAHADELVRQMPHMLDTIVGERGSILSGGERQRIAIARALLRGPRLLVLDEATGAIDSPGEREILSTLRDLPARPTIVLIAHRTENLDLCDRVMNF